MMRKDTAILLVDDSMAMRQTVKNILTDNGYTNIDTAINGKEAVSFIRAGNTNPNGKKYKVIFLDWNMPEMDGLEFLQMCRGELGLKDVAIVMLTVVSDQKSVTLALNNGATSYITKPVSAKTILEKIEQIGGWLETQAKPESKPA